MRTQSAKEIWEAAKGALQVQVSKANYETWLKDTLGVSYLGNQFIIGTPSAFAKEWLEKRLHSLVKKTLIGIVKEDIEVHFQVCPQKEAISSTAGYSKIPSGRKSSSKPNPKYTFDTFIVGRCNRLAYAAALGVAEEPGQKYNPLFIYGGVGLGKTHLTCAIGNAASDSGFNVLYTSTEQFTNEFISGIKEKKTEEFRSKFRNADILLLDDIHFINGKPQTQEGLFHTFNELHHANRQIVITSDRPPSSLSLLKSRLGSRFEWGIITAIQFPDLETRLAILRAKADQLKICLDDAVLEFVASKCKRSIRQLEGSLNRLVAFAKLLGKPPTLELAEKALQMPTVDGTSIQNPDPEFILNAVADYYNLSIDDLRSKRRDQKIALARHISIYLIREKSDCPLHIIGNILGGRDHSTIIHAHRRVSDQLPTDSKLQMDINEILQNLPASATR